MSRRPLFALIGAFAHDDALDAVFYGSLVMCSATTVIRAFLG